VASVLQMYIPTLTCTSCVRIIQHLSVTKGGKSANKRMKLSAMQKTPSTEGSDSSNEVKDVRQQASAAYQSLVDNNGSSAALKPNSSNLSSVPHGNSNSAMALSALAAMASAENVQGTTAAATNSSVGYEHSRVNQTHNRKVSGAMAVPPPRLLRPLLPMGYDSGADPQPSNPAAMSSGTAAMLAAAAAMADLTPNAPEATSVNSTNSSKIDVSSARKCAEQAPQSQYASEYTGPAGLYEDGNNALSKESSGQLDVGAWAMNEFTALRATWAAAALRQQEAVAAAGNSDNGAEAGAVNSVPGAVPDKSRADGNTNGGNVGPQRCEAAGVEQTISNIGDLCKDGQSLAAGCRRWCLR